MSEGASMLEEGEIHDILRNDRRREIISFLSQHDGRTTIRELSEHIATVESGEEPPPRNVRQSVYVSLHQTHLPKLEALGVVDYDTDSKDIRVRERMTQVEIYMDPSNGTSEWAPIYAGLGVFGVLWVVVGIVGGFNIEPITLSLFLVIAASAGYQVWLR